MGRKLKILQVASHNLIRAGGSVQMARLARGLKKKGHEVWCAFNFKGNEKVPGLGSFEPLVKERIAIRSFRMQKYHKYFHYLRFRKFVQDYKFDIIHAHRFRALQFVLRSTAGMKVPVLIGNKKNSFSLDREMIRGYSSRRLDRIIVNARVIRDILIKEAEVKEDKIAIVYNGVDMERFHPGVSGNGVRSEYGLNGNVPVMGMIANFTRKKSHHIFFEAALEVLKERPEVKFLLVGQGDCGQYQLLVKEYGVEGSFIFTGFRQDIPEIIASLDVSVISSGKGEGLTGSMVEAMTMATPVISTDVAGNAEMVIDGETGFLVPAGDGRRLKEAMLFSLTHPDKAKEIGRKGYDFIKAKVSNERRTTRIEEIYCQVLQQKQLM
ncbi:MAG: glycosyltransferase family 4 protein [Thermodesulfobacteriota bacterium]